MSRLQRAPEKTTEVHEELEELEDYSPQHPLLAYEPKMNLVRAPDHLQQYVEVNPFEHQFQPAEGIYNSVLLKTPPKGKENDYVKCKVSASLSWKNKIKCGGIVESVSAPTSVTEVDNLEKVHLKTGPTTTVFVEKKEEAVPVDDFKKKLFDAVKAQRRAFLNQWTYTAGGKTKKLNDLFQLGTNNLLVGCPNFQSTVPVFKIYLTCKSSKIIGWKQEEYKKKIKDKKFKQRYTNFSNWQKLKFSS